MSYTICNLITMKERELLKKLEVAGLSAYFMCENHSDSCNCHKIYDEAA